MEGVGEDCGQVPIHGCLKHLAHQDVTVRCIEGHGESVKEIRDIGEWFKTLS